MTTDDSSESAFTFPKGSDDLVAAVSRDQEQERQIAIFDLIEDNYFQPVGAEAVSAQHERAAVRADGEGEPGG